jgi:hypothetical protein
MKLLVHRYIYNRRCDAINAQKFTKLIRNQNLIGELYNLNLRGFYQLKAAIITISKINHLSKYGHIKTIINITRIWKY